MVNGEASPKVLLMLSLRHLTQSAVIVISLQDNLPLTTKSFRMGATFQSRATFCCEVFFPMFSLPLSFTRFDTLRIPEAIDTHIFSMSSRFVHHSSQVWDYACCATIAFALVSPSV